MTRKRQFGLSSSIERLSGWPDCLAHYPPVAPTELLFQVDGNDVPLSGLLDGLPHHTQGSTAQHALIEYARNVACLDDADHAESNPDATTLVVTPLACSLVGESGRVTLDPDTRAAEWYGGLEGTEEYVCSHGLNPEHRELFETGPMRIVGRDDDGDPRIVELTEHPFFVATLFQPELRSEGEGVHPLVVAFVEASAKGTRLSPGGRDDPGSPRRRFSRDS